MTELSRTTKCRARVGLDTCGNPVAHKLDLCPFHAGLRGAWATASLRRPFIEEIYARIHPYVLASQRIFARKTDD
jgi:hypothetical protein